MYKILFGVIALILLPISPAWSASKTFEITVDAGQFDRQNVPVCVQIADDQLEGMMASVTLTDADGNRIPAQVTGPSLVSGQGREVHFVLPHLPAGKTLQLTAVFSSESPPNENGFVWHDHAGKYTRLEFGDRPITSYHYEKLDESTPADRLRTYKVFHHLYSPRGDRIVTNGLLDDPKVHSPHHRGIFFGFNRITYDNDKSADVWHCIDGAYQEHEKFLAQEEGKVLGRHRVVIGWHGGSGDRKAFLEEERELTFFSVPGGQLVEFASRLRTTGGPVRLDGDPQHAGFHFRAHNDVDALTSQQTFFIRTDGIGQLGETRNWDPSTAQGPVNLPWNAMSFILGDKRYTTAYLDHPNNPKEARFSEREYGRFGSYFEYTIEEDKPLTVNYRLWLQEGAMTPEEVAALSADFVHPPKVTVKAK